MKNNGFFTGLLVTLILRSRGLLVTLVCIALHFAMGLSLKWAAAAFLVWLLYALIMYAMVVVAGRCRNIPKEQQGVEMHPGRTATFDEMYKKGRAGNGNEA